MCVGGCLCVCVKTTNYLGHACSTFYFLPETMAKLGLHAGNFKLRKQNKTKVYKCTYNDSMNLLCSFLSIMYTKIYS